MLSVHAMIVIKQTCTQHTQRQSLCEWNTQNMRSICWDHLLYKRNGELRVFQMNINRIIYRYIFVPWTDVSAVSRPFFNITDINTDPSMNIKFQKTGLSWFNVFDSEESENYSTLKWNQWESEDCKFRVLRIFCHILILIYCQTDSRCKGDVVGSQLIYFL